MNEFPIGIFTGLIIGFPLGVFADIQANSTIPTIKESYCTKYTHSVTEYKTCKDSNLVEFIKKGGGNE